MVRTIAVASFPILAVIVFLIVSSCDFMDLEVAAKGTATTADDESTGSTNTRIATTKLLSPDLSADDRFGYSVSISGDYLIAGAGYEDTGGSNAGAAYIFHRTGTNTWDSGVKIMAADAQADDHFGLSVAISGDYAIVGAYFEDTGGSYAGAAYIFHRTGTNSWDTGVKIVAPDAQANDLFGWSVAISGDYGIVGARGEDSGGSASGAAYIFYRTGTNSWDAGVKVTASDASAQDKFGWSVAISGDYAIVGAYYQESIGGLNTNTGAAYIFNRTGTNSWDAGVRITAYDAQPDDQFGSSVAISGDYIIVGAPDVDSAGDDSGAAYTYRRIGTNSWDPGVKIIAHDSQAQDSFGVSVSISGEYAVVGADRKELYTGAAYLFQRIGTNNWNSGVKLIAFDGQTMDFFGWTVAISGDYIVIGAYEEESGGSDAGAVYGLLR